MRLAYVLAAVPTVNTKRNTILKLLFTSILANLQKLIAGYFPCILIEATTDEKEMTAVAWYFQFDKYTMKVLLFCSVLRRAG